MKVANPAPTFPTCEGVRRGSEGGQKGVMKVANPAPTFTTCEGVSEGGQKGVRRGSKLAGGASFSSGFGHMTRGEYGRI
eukprot:1178964-Prorocentrum_minimum.AAC.7